MLPPRFTPSYLKNIEQLRLWSKRSFIGSKQGGHLSLRRGHGIEFSDYRRYEPGDDPRRIDWGVYARSDRLYVKRYREEEDLNVLLILDTSPSLFTPPADNKWEIARDLALTLAYIALIEQDTVSLALLGAPYSPHYSGARAIHEVGNLLMNTQSARTYTFEKEIRRAAAQIRFPGKAILFSDLMLPFAEIRSGCNALRAKNLDITVIHLIGPSDREPWQLVTSGVAVDSETEEEVTLDFDEATKRDYTVAFQKHQQRCGEFFSEAKIQYAPCNTMTPLLDLVTKNLTTLSLIR
jgi:uncharacterized protein (DUF58 family)